MGRAVEEGHKIWMKEALWLASRALRAGEFPVGCVLVSGNRVVAAGSRLNSTGRETNELDHAEIIALRNWVKAGKPGDKVTAYSTLEPCLMCTGALLISGVTHIVFAYEDVMGGACGIDLEGTFSAAGKEEDCIYRGAGLTVIPGILRQESIRLFKDFFLNPQNTYLEDSALEKYTLYKA